MAEERATGYSWYVVLLGVLVNMIPLGIAWMAMAVLFSEIAEELDLSLVQLGTIWGALPLAGALFAIPGGLLADRFGVRLVVGMAILLTGILGALRGMSDSFLTLAVFMFLFGGSVWLAFPNVGKTIGMWFPQRQLGLANGLALAGYGAGGILAAMLSTAVLSPALGGWRNVLFIYGALSAALGILWLLTVRERVPVGVATSRGGSMARVSFREALSRVSRVRDLWLLVASFVLFGSGFFGVLGYLPTYLEDKGMPVVVASGVFATFLLGDLVGNIIMPLVSDRLGLRKVVFIPCALLTAIGIVLYALFSGAPLWAAAVMGGIFAGVGAPMAMIVPVEMKGVGLIYAGTAVGLAFAAFNLGGFVSPIVGGALAEVNPLWAFILWGAAMGASGIVFWFLEETGHRHREAKPPA